MDKAITSDFKFISYKVDDLELKVIRNIDILAFSGYIDPSLWEFKVAILHPLFLEAKNIYIGGVSCNLYLFPKDLEKNKKTPENALIFLKASISGAFRIEGKQFDSDTEQQLIKLRIPSILFPYLRATITSLLANSGFGSIVLPLINMNAIAEKMLEKMEVKVIPT